MDIKFAWLIGLVALSWAYCLFWAARGGSQSKTASDFFAAGRALPPWAFLLAATAMSFSALSFMGHPALIYRDGFPYAFASLSAIAITLAGVLFLRRQWMLGRRFGYLTPGEMLADYFQGELIRILTLIVALLFAISIVAVQLSAAGILFQVVTDGVLDRQVEIWLLAVVLFITVASGGLRAVVQVDALHGLLLAGGIIALGVVVYRLMGGWEAFNLDLAGLAASDIGSNGLTAQGRNALFAMPGVIQFSAGIGVEAPVGGPWTASMVLTYMLALMGIPAAPVFSMWALASRSARPFAAQQVWLSAFGIGLILVFFATPLGMGGLLLGANAEVNETGLAISGVLDPEPVIASADDIVPSYINLAAGIAPWFAGLLALSATAAMLCTGAALTSAGGMLARDLYKRYLARDATDGSEMLVGRIGIAGIVLGALLAASFSDDHLALLAGIAGAFGLQMAPALAALCWFPWITRQGASWGLVAGLLGVSLTEPFGIQAIAWFGIEMPWGRWPWTIHSAGWGIVFNAIVCVIVSAVTQSVEDRAHRQGFHDFLHAYGSLSRHKRLLVPIAWGLSLAWLYFAIGPGAVNGNVVFGAPSAGIDNWLFGMPSIWAWQVLFWTLGVGRIWFLAYPMELSTAPRGDIQIATKAPQPPA